MLRDVSEVVIYIIIIITIGICLSSCISYGEPRGLDPTLMRAFREYVKDKQKELLTSQERFMPMGRLVISFNINKEIICNTRYFNGEKFIYGRYSNNNTLYKISSKYESFEDGWRFKGRLKVETHKWYSGRDTTLEKPEPKKQNRWISNE